MPRPRLSDKAREVVRDVMARPSVRGPKPKVLTCKQPDRHGLGLVCGYPLPCPYHTVVVEMPKKRGKR